MFGFMEGQRKQCVRVFFVGVYLREVVLCVYAVGPVKGGDMMRDDKKTKQNKKARVVAALYITKGIRHSDRAGKVAAVELSSSPFFYLICVS